MDMECSARIGITKKITIVIICIKNKHKLNTDVKTVTDKTTRGASAQPEEQGEDVA